MAELKITVVVPTYNRYKDLQNLIKTFLLQNYQNKELLIIDDLGSPKIGETSKKWMKKSNKIIYHKNKRNLGVVENIRNSFSLVSGGVIVFMGDDDIFIDNDALSIFAKTFSRPRVGMAKASQVLFKNGKINQVFPLKKNGEETIYYYGKDFFENNWFESISFTGLAFINNPKIRSLINNSSTLFPQVELAGLVGIFYKTAEINRHLVGVQSYSSGQLNPVSYSVDGVRTNIVEDWMQIYGRINRVARNQKKPFIEKTRFIQKLSYFTLFLLPYNTLTNGRIGSTKLILNILKYNKRIFLSPLFWISTLVSLLLPKKLITQFLTFIKKIRTSKALSDQDLKRINSLLAKYY